MKANWEKDSALKIVMDKIGVDYEILDYLGGGGLSKIYKVRQNFFGDFRTLKIMDVDYLSQIFDILFWFLLIRGAYQMPLVGARSTQDTLKFHACEYIGMACIFISFKFRWIKRLEPGCKNDGADVNCDLLILLGVGFKRNRFSLTGGHTLKTLATPATVKATGCFFLSSLFIK